MKIAGVIIIIASFIVYYLLQTAGVDKQEADIFYWLPNMIGLCVLFWGIGKGEERRVKHLVYYPASYFYGVLALIYLLDKAIDPFINVNKIVLTLIITTITCLLYYFFYRNLHK